MIKLSESAGRVIAGDSVAVFNATDEALLNSARLAVSVLEGTAQSGMHPRTKQKLLDSMSNGHTKLLDSRREFAAAQAQMVVIQKRSTIAPHSWGCWAEDANVTVDSSIEENFGTILPENATAFGKPCRT